MPATSSVVVLSYRPGTWLSECLASVLPQTDEVILVDNGSAAEEASAIGREMGVKVVRSAENLGFAGGVNLGLAHTSGEIVGLLNDDATAGPGWLRVAAEALTDPTVAAVTPKVVLNSLFAEVVLDDDPWFAAGDARPLGRQLRSVTAGGTDVLEDALGGGLHPIEDGDIDGRPSKWRWTSGRRPFYVPLADEAEEVRIDGEPVAARHVGRLINHAGSILTREGTAAEYGYGAPDDGRFDQPAERFGFSATAPVVRSETFRRLGGLAPEFFAYNEDTDWCMRAHLAGLRILYDPSAVVRHRLSATSGGNKSSSVHFLAHRNYLLCLARNAPTKVATQLLWRRLTDHPLPGVRRAVLAKLPWAVASRLRMRALWVTTPEAVWTRWAGADAQWDEGMFRLQSHP